MSKTTLTAAEARAAAAEAARIARELEAAEAEKQKAEQERHEQAVADYWQSQRETLADRVRGRREAAWSAFERAVLTGEGDAVSLFAKYRVEDALVAEERHAIDRYYEAVERARIEEDAAEHQALLREAGWVRAVSVGDIVIREEDVDEAGARVAAFEAAKANWNERHPLEEGMTAAYGINPPARRSSNPSGLPYAPPAEGLSFSLAVDRVIAAHVERELARVRQEQTAAITAL